MDTLQQIKTLVEQMSVDTRQVFEKGNQSAAIRARETAQVVKQLIPIYRKEVLDKIKQNKRHNKNYGKNKGLPIKTLKS